MPVVLESLSACLEHIFHSSMRGEAADSQVLGRFLSVTSSGLS